MHPRTLAIASSGVALGGAVVLAAAPAAGVAGVRTAGVWTGSASGTHAASAARATTAPATVGDLRLADVTAAGVKATYTLNRPRASVSAGGRYVAFNSAAADFGLGGDGENDYVYRKDMVTGRLAMVSTTKLGAAGRGLYPSISADGRFVAFFSDDTTLGPVTGGNRVYLKDMTTGALTLVSRTAGGAPGDQLAYDARVSADGGAVVFTSTSDGLGTPNPRHLPQVWKKDMGSGTLTLVSPGRTGGVADAPVDCGAPSRDGRYVAYYSYADNLTADDRDGLLDVYVRDTTTGTTTLMSSSSTGVKGNGDSGRFIFDCPDISADGRYVAFQSSATNLDPGDREHHEDVYVKNRATGQLRLASTTTAGVRGTGYASQPSLSADGKWVLFASNATNLAPPTDQRQNVYLKNRVTGRLTLVSVTGWGVRGDHVSLFPALSGDAGTAVFLSRATDFLPADHDVVVDVYVKSLG